MRFGYLIYLMLVVNTADSLDVDVEALLNKMDIEDKCGQMNQITIDVVQKDESEVVLNENPINVTRLREAILDYKVGSIQNTPFTIDRNGQKRPVAQMGHIWQEMIKMIQDVGKETKLKIPLLYGIDSIHGANYIQEAVLFPHALNLAATFNLKIAEKIGEVVAMETRSVGIPWNFYPVLDVGRQPVWPRTYETFGEDVHLTCKMGEALVKGHQGSDLKNQNKTATCLKHYIGYSYPFNGRDRSVAWIPEILLREVFLPPFETALKAGAVTVMINSGDVNGVPGHANYYYLTKILKQELGLKGFTISDWEDIIRLHTRDKVAETPEEAVRIAVMAGIDVSIVPFDFSFYKHCVSLANTDSKFKARVDDAVRKILTVKEALGLFKNPYPDPNSLKFLGIDSSEELNLDAARESIILAKNNNNILPLSKSASVLVTGPTGNLIKVLNSGWSYTWLGDVEEYFQNFGRKKLTVFEAIKNKAINTQYVEGANFTSTTDINEAVEIAKSCEIVVFCIGEDTYTETPGNIDNMMLSESQMRLADELFKTGKKMVVVFIGGRPRTITSIVERADGLLLAFLPGNKGAEAIADIIFGDYNPNAKLPISYPRQPNSYIPYDHKSIEAFDSFNKYDPLFPFGHGMSYTSFKYSDLILDKSEVYEPNTVFGNIAVKNIGNRSGKEIVIVHLNDEYAKISRPNKQMKFFKKVELNPNEEKIIQFEITRNDMSFIDMDNNRIVESGRFNVYVGNLQQSFNLIAKSKLEKNAAKIISENICLLNYATVSLLSLLFKYL